MSDVEQLIQAFMDGETRLCMKEQVMSHEVLQSYLLLKILDRLESVDDTLITLNAALSNGTQPLQGDSNRDHLVQTIFHIVTEARTAMEVYNIDVLFRDAPYNPESALDEIFKLCLEQLKNGRE